MGGRALALLLVSGVALADPPAHQMYIPETPETVGAPNWVLTPSGYQNLKDHMSAQWSELESCSGERERLRADVVRLSAEPALTWKGALVLVGVGLVVGAAVAVPVSLAARK